MRQRVPFRFSEDEDQEDHILDEQEQEAVIDRLRQTSASSNAIYLLGLQAAIGLSFLLHALYAFRSPKRSPFAVLFPDVPSEAPVPLASLLVLLQTAIQCNLSLNVLPPNHWLRHAVQTNALPPSFRPPIPLSHPVTIILPLVAPVYALLLGQGWIDVLWWSTAGILTGIVAVALQWMKEAEAALAELEKLRYVARGA
ncbi:uncharacterized protein TRAVEDRAFT_122460 [Trametes versicolor FP-101664 SS1]|uniref:uncharacterized protein n=1 Tax=Trametes versicolor (strain FP-101664) TaxID=717944 RepID=UPI00046234AD|nr:uncharacterized protein TRAVEDRAFT_122460 [Trametes versicolor FP-101664 SS1]EIW59236.1 hypothetical protein TRAVEDRAFT_122460 [Trametes versicolor FP-101664 SS1]